MTTLVLLLLLLLYCLHLICCCINTILVPAIYGIFALVRCEILICVWSIILFGSVQSCPSPCSYPHAYMHVCYCFHCPLTICISNQVVSRTQRIRMKLKMLHKNFYNFPMFWELQQPHCKALAFASELTVRSMKYLLILVNSKHRINFFFIMLLLLLLL